MDRHRHKRAHRRGIRAWTAVLVTGIGISACGSSGTDQPVDASGPPRQGGSVTVLLPTESRALDPFTATATTTADGSRLAALYDLLMWTDMRTGKVEMQTAASFAPDDASATTWTLRLKPGITFSDGSAYDAAAVKFTWDRHADPAVRSQVAGSAKGLVSTVVDPLTLRVVLPAPNANFDQTVASNLTYIAAPSAVTADPVGYASKPVGAGPFVLKDWVRGDHQSMVRNPRYWQADRPHLDQVTFKTIPDSHQILNTLGSGGADLAPMTQKYISDQAGEKGLRAETVGLDGGQYVAFNLTRRPFDDVRARRALAMAFDATAMDKDLFGPGVRAPTAGLLRNGSPLVDPSVRQLGYDRAEAQRLFDELAAEGKAVSFSYVIPQNPASAKTAEYMQSRLQAFRNVDMRVEKLEIGAYLTKTQVQKDFQAMLFSGWHSDPDLMYSRFHSDSPQNLLGYSSPEVDRALDAGRSTQDPQLRRTAYTAFARQINLDVPVWVYLEATMTAVSRPGITGVQAANDGVFLFDRLGRSG